MNAGAAAWEAAYRASCYAFAWQGAWRRFALDGDQPPYDDLPAPATLITAWNPNSEAMPAAWNEEANARLRAALVAAHARWDGAYGGSLPGVTPEWREDGFVVFGWEPAAAARWGRDFGQRAVVRLDAAGTGLLFCADERFVPCGLRRL